MTGADVAKHSGLSQSKISKLETASLTPSRDDIERFADAIGVARKVRKELVDHAELLQTEFNSFRMLQRNGRNQTQLSHQELEQGAKTIRTFQPAVVPGLLQTAAYAQEVVSASVTAGSKDAGEVVAARLERQTVLYDISKTFSFVLLESVLRYPFGDDRVMLAQLDRLGTLATLDNVSIGIVPLGTSAGIWPNNGFVIYDDEIATAETFTAEMVLHSPADIRLYENVFDRFDRASARDKDALIILEQVGSSYR